MVRQLALAATVYSLGSSACISDRQLLKAYVKDSVSRASGMDYNIDGTYKNSSSGRGPNLLAAFIPCRPLSCNKKYRSDSSASIELRYEKPYLSVIARFADSTIEHRRIAATRRSDFISLRRSFFFLPIPLFFFINDEKTILFMDAEKNLHAVTGRHGMGWVLFFVAGTDGTSITKFSSPMQ